MKICLFCENQYAIGILMPLQEEADREGGNDVLWYVHEKKIPDFPLKDSVRYTNSIQEIKDFHPDAIFVPGNIVPYYLSGVKIEIFHGYAEKRDQFVIRRYFDTYFTQGPFYTSRFKELAKKYKDFEVLETGWTRQDWVFQNLHSYDDKRNELDRKLWDTLPEVGEAIGMPVFKNPIRISQDVKKAQDQVQSLFDAYPNSNAAFDYARVTKEILEEKSSQIPKEDNNQININLSKAEINTLLNEISKKR